MSQNPTTQLGEIPYGHLARTLLVQAIPILTAFVLVYETHIGGVWPGNARRPSSNHNPRDTALCTLSQDILKAQTQEFSQSVSSFLHSRPSAPELTRTEWIHKPGTQNTSGCNHGCSPQITGPIPLRSWKRRSQLRYMRSVGAAYHVHLEILRNRP